MNRSNPRVPDTTEPDYGWRGRAACIGEDPDMFMFDAGYMARQARAICAGCPVRAECLADAMATETGDHTHRAGIRGGMSARWRAAAAQRERYAAGAVKQPGTRPLAPCGTPAAYDRHLRNQEPIDDACRDANNRRRQAERARKRERERKAAA